MTKVTLENLHEFGIGHNFQDNVYPQDFEGIVYGADIEGNLSLVDPTKKSGDTPFWKEPTGGRWWKMALKA